ncbi:hypothetical protein AGMMS50256_26740 [Betaproteobacteria bacterium]|nr:hypothetical protein AGMMS50256_26740 [Betaproteobacteria bacterium]
MPFKIEKDRLIVVNIKDGGIAWEQSRFDIYGDVTVPLQGIHSTKLDNKANPAWALFSGWH